MTSSKAGIGGAFQPIKEKQAQNQPGLEKDLAPTSESTKLEGAHGFVEYVGSGKLEDKKAIVTGGDSGIGRSVAILMAREGADVTIIYLREEQEDAEVTAEAIRKEGRECLLYPGNLTDEPTCKYAVAEHVKKFGRIDILVNNASRQFLCKDFTTINLNTVKDTFESNILQMITMCKYAVPHMEKGSSIINTSSVTAFRGSGSLIDYASTKGAIISFTKSLAKNLMPKGIRVNAVAPGPVHTPIQPASRPAEQMEGFGSGSQIGRPGQPSEVAPSFIFLASKEASLYYGQVLHPYPLGD
ncbi:hypothetical protein H112_05613 [Trichophyton rubrum D6]|uniref:Oxidoreductase n=3 Tax=Trichophyton rubrum TaxID=5551 RepID=A0A178ERV2_TRIRU|nr:uncharacterized protein TERG_03340 [Trichophyton rubrum CBS 118892]EZF16610.1 hypothetical protein H100_05631 [Trichophyton rubrum MR850]EZF40289.1 hypothetical protein H102_05598 [Trichophyton rubrum CBS 100081]EZF51035.1 hypothetical protein H103_05622 [Trichophyton rubrum CBS 288.86]EZF61514.1 hypothetical protein H104_05612 [Trichophyton rubrum CBS 289.86]EZF82935.1 hypothetical protein H110_05621 [Trichophyton rubrum MR1448]EZF93479.1 hypothetical protein H113_05667 [Trichophyton rubr